ncbi:MAG: AbrB/MazE/SpoVT family DNA-binding domain-containing protein [Candidatus Bathyarchaeia archaeon]
MSVVKLSSRGQVVIPKSIRERLGLRNGDRLKILIEAKKITLVPITELPQDLFVEGRDEAVREALSEAKRVDEGKLAELLAALGVKD